MLYSGVTGKITTKKGTGTATTLAHMANWSVDCSKDIIEVVSFGDDYKEKIPSVKDWSASCDGKADFATGNGQRELQQAFEDGSLLVCSFYLNTGTYATGNAYVESLSISDAADGAADISIGVAGSGPLTLTYGT